MPIAQITAASRRLAREVTAAVIDMDHSVHIAIAAILAGGHVLFEDVPGLGKTVAARSLAHALGLEFRRVQCTPDLLPSDITGSFVYAPATQEFSFRPGPIFAGFVLADEINRTTPKTQSALLEAMAESQVTVEGERFPLEAPFHVIATSNPIEYEGTYALPEAQLDRFMVRLSVGYPDADGEARMLRSRLDRQRDPIDVEAVTDPDALLAMQRGLETVHVDPDVIAYCVELARRTRTDPSVEVGVSPRGTQDLVLLARAWAVLADRAFVTPDDVKAVAAPALAHRLSLSPQAWADGVQNEAVIRRVVESADVPPVVASGA